MNVQEQANVKVTLNNDEANRELDQTNARIEKLIQLRKKAEAEGDVKSFKKINTELGKARREAKKYEQQLFDVDKVLKNLNGASIDELERAEKSLKAQTKGLNRESREYIELAGKQTIVRSELRKTRGIVNSQRTAWERLRNSTAAWIAGIGIGIATVVSFARRMGDAASAANNFDERLKNLSALTGLEGRALADLGRTAKETSVKIDENGIIIQQNADDIVDAYTKVGSQRPELLKNGEALASVTEDAIILSEAAKSKLEPAVEGLTTTMNQFKLESDQSRRIINAMAAGSKEGAANIPYLTQAIEKSGTTFKLMNLEVEDNIGIIEAIAPNYAKAEMAGNSLDKVFLRLKQQQIGYVNGTFNLNAALDELSKRYANGESAASIFGVEHAKMGELLVQNRADIERYTKAVTGTNIAIEQARKNTNNDNAIQKQARNEFHLSAIELGQNLSPALAHAYRMAGSVAKAFSGWIATSPVEELQKEGDKVNQLAVELTNSNTPLKRRKDILDELNKISPDIVAGLDAEKLNYEKLKENLAGYNEELANRILLENLSESEKKYAAQTAKFKSELASMQVDILDIIAKTDKNIALSGDSLEEKQQKTLQLLKERASGALDVFDGVVSDTRNKEAMMLSKLQLLLANTTTAQENLNEAQSKQVDFSKRKKEMMDLLGIEQKTNETPKVGTRKTIGNMVFEWDGKDWKKVKTINGGAPDKDALKALDLAHAQQILSIKQFYADKENLQKESQARQLAAEIAYLQAKLNLETDEEKRIDLQSKIIDTQLKYTQALKEAVPEILNTDKAAEKLNNRLFEQGKLMDFAAQKQREGERAQKEATERQRQQADTIQMIGGVVTDYVTGAINGTMDQYATFGDTLILMSLQILKQMVPIWSAQILGYSLSSFESVATWGAAGVAKWVAITALMDSAIALAESGINSKIERKRQAAQSSTQYASGKYPMMGSNDGKVYDTNFAGRPKTGLYSGPQLGIFNEDPNNPELVVDGKTTRQLMIDYPAVYRGIRQLAAGYSPQFASGKYPNQGQDQFAPGTPYSDKTLSDLTAAIRDFMKWKPGISVEKYEKVKNEYEDMQNRSGFKYSNNS